MRFARVLTTAIGWMVCVWSGAARAQDVRLQGLFEGSVGFTDNLANASSRHPSNVAGPQADLLFVLSPGAALLFDTERVAQRLGYTFNTNLYASHSEANSYTNSVGWGARFETSETTSLFLGLTGQQGQLNAIVINQPGAPAAPVAAQATGSNIFFNAGGSEGFEKQLSDVLTASQGTSLSAYLPVDGQRAYFWDNTLGLTRTWERDTGALGLGVGYTQFDSRTTAAGVFFPMSKQLLNRATATWTHQFTEHFSTQAQLGVLYAVRVTDGQGGVWQPLGRAALMYHREEAIAELAYSHTGAPNLQTGTNTLSDSVSASLLVPIPATYFSVAGSGGYTRARDINGAGEIGPGYDVLQGEAALLWAPLSVAGNLQFALRYQVLRQQAPEQVPAGFNAPTSFIRDTILFTVALAYPSVDIATAPAESGPPFQPTPRGTEDIERNQSPTGPRTTESPTTPRPPAPP